MNPDMGQESSVPTRTRPRSPEIFERNVRPKLEGESEHGLTSNDNLDDADQMNGATSQPSETRLEQQAATVGGPVQRTSPGTAVPGIAAPDTTAPGMNKGIQLALAHLLQNGAEHPLHQRNVDYIVNGLLSNADLDAVVCKPFEDLCASGPLTTHLDLAKTSNIKSKIANGILQKMLFRVGMMVDGVGDVCARAEMETSSHRLMFKISPIYVVQDTGAESNDRENEIWNDEPTADGNAGANGIQGEARTGNDRSTSAQVDSAVSNPFNLSFKPFFSDGDENRKIALEDLALLESKNPPPKRVRNRAGQKIESAISKLRPHNVPKSSCKHSIELSGQGLWLVRFLHEVDVSAFVDRSVTTTLGEVRFKHLGDLLPQVFVCNALASKTDYPQVVRDLFSIMPDHELYAAQAKTGGGISYLLVVLRRPMNVKRFSFSMKLTTGGSWMGSFNAIWKDKRICTICSKKHHTYDCPLLKPIQLEGPTPKGLLTRCPLVTSVV